MKKVYNVLLFVLFTMSITAQTTFLVENFDYPQGDEIRFYGWTAHSAGGTNPILVSAEGLSLATSAYAGNGIGNAAWVINNGSDENKPFSQWVRQPEEGQDPVHTYASFLMRPFGEIPEATGNTRPYFFHFGEYNEIEDPEFSDLSTAFRARTFIYPGTLPNTFQMNLSFNENVPEESNRTGNYNANDVHLIVVKYTSIAGEENDEVSLYVFRDGDDFSAEPATPTIGPLKGTNRDVVVQAVALRQYQDDQNVIVDGIIVRDHWDMTGTTTSTTTAKSPEPLRVYPNPVAGDELMIDTGLDGAFDLTIYDMSGRLVMARQELYNGSLRLNGLQSGAYIVRVNQNDKVFQQRLIVH